MTLYELCAMGVPMITYSFADNQMDNVTWFYEGGIMDYRDVRHDRIFEQVGCYRRKYCANRGLRQERSRLMQSLVDGKGAECIAELLMKEKFGDHVNYTNYSKKSFVEIQ